MCVREHMHWCVCDFPRSSSTGLAELNNIYIHWLTKQCLLWDLPLSARADVSSWVKEIISWKRWVFLSNTISCVLKQTYLNIHVSQFSLNELFVQQLGFTQVNRKTKTHQCNMMFPGEALACICPSCDFTEETIQESLYGAFLHGIGIWG